jgi:hypothetical protein
MMFVYWDNLDKVAMAIEVKEWTNDRAETEKGICGVSWRLTLVQDL